MKTRDVEREGQMNYQDIVQDLPLWFHDPSVSALSLSSA